jgi:RNA polymerase sigma factor (sigma-70 family)
MGTSDTSVSRDLEQERCLRAERLEACLPSLMSYVRRLVGDAEIARDVMQNISVVILTASEAPTDGGQFAAWCRGVARNLAAYERRARRRSQSMIEDSDIEHDRPDPETNPEESTNSRKVLRSLVRELGADEFELLVRRYVLEEDSNELATELAQSPAALRMRLMRLRAILRDRALRVLPIVFGLLEMQQIAHGMGS